MTKIKIFKGFWTVKDVRKRPNYLFIFGDNDVKKGKGGQAVIRSEPNVAGIPTDKKPGKHPDSYYTDDEYDLNKKKIMNAINYIIELSAEYEAVVLPEAGFGTGLADLPNKAPKTYKFLLKAVKYLKANI